MDLPSLNDVPTRHPDCCLSLSTVFLDRLTSLLGESARRGLVLSIGSGTGLLEALLLSKWSSLAGNEFEMEGVEVHQLASASMVASANKYLPENHYSTVKGTWELSPRTAVATVLLFVYPRSRGLVQRYLEKLTRPSSDPSSAQMAVWLGPKCDWTTFREAFADIEGFELVENVDVGLADYEMLAVIKSQAGGRARGKTG
jgi:hypothetical protein